LLAESRGNLVDISHVKSGMYLVRVETNKGGVTKKIIVR